MADQSQQTEKATPRRLEKARKEGNFPTAREFVVALQFLTFVLLAASGFSAWLKAVVGSFHFALSHAFGQVFGSPVQGGADVQVFVKQLVAPVFGPLVRTGAVLMAVTLLAQLVATNLGFSLANLAPKPSRLNPISRLRNLPGDNTQALLQSLLVMPVVLLLAWGLVRDHLNELLRLPLMPVGPGAARIGSLIGDILRKLAYVLLVVGAARLGRERFRYAKRLRMSRREVMDEAKETQGNPHTKGRIRRLQRDARRRNMMKSVSTAAAVIVNPTHYAVALHYEQGTSRAPRVVAKGKNYLAARIRKRAIECQIPIIENPPLAQTLYKSVEVGQEIPAHLYRAVAEILAYIFRLAGRKRS